MDLSSISPKELSILANVVAIALAEGRSADELNVLGNFVVAVGGLLLTIAAQQQSLLALQEKQQQNQGSKNKPNTIVG